MRASPLSIASITLNVVLLGALIVSWRSDSESAQASSSSSSSKTPSTAASENLAALVAKVRSQGVSEQMAYQLAFARARATTAIVVPDDYWKPAPLRSEALREAEYKSTVATRELLLKHFGPDALNHPAFTEVFRPLRQRFGFLSPDKQIQLQQILFETGEGGLSFSGRNSQTRNERLTRVRALLDDNEFLEYQLRESMWALRLANSGMDFTENEFRAVYAAAAAADAESARVDPLRTAMPRIKRALSPARFAAFERVQDPTFLWLRSGAARFGAKEDAIIKAYDLIRDVDRRALELQATPTTAETRGELIATRDRQLKLLLGEQMFHFTVPRLHASGEGSHRWPGDPAAAFIPPR